MRVLVRERHLPSVFAPVTSRVPGDGYRLFKLAPQRGVKGRSETWAQDWARDPRQGACAAGEGGPQGSIRAPLRKVGKGAS